MTTSRRLLVALGSSSLAVLAALVVCSACSSDDGSGGQGLVVNNLGTCQIAYDADNGEYPVAALPTGQACTAETSCTLPIDTCAADFTGATASSNLTIYECDCLDGGWACYAATKVDTSCEDASAAPSEDAGADAGEATLDATSDGEASVDSSSVDVAADATGEDGSADGAVTDAASDAADQ